MADKISASITYLDANNNKGTKAITDISPNADNGSIKDFCVGLLGLTTNTLSQIDRVEKTDITSATAKPKLALELTSEARNGIYITDQFYSNQLFNESNLPNFTYKVESSIPTIGKFNATLLKSSGSGGVYFASTIDSTPAESGTYTMTIYFEETETTAATTAQLVISENKLVFTIL